jgi:hypothetical protein
MNGLKNNLITMNNGLQTFIYTLYTCLHFNHVILLIFVDKVHIVFFNTL